MHRARRLERYLSQPFFVVAEHTGIAGVSVPLASTLGDCEALLRGDYDALPEEIQAVVSPKEYAWLSAAEKHRLTQDLTEPDPEP